MKISSITRSEADKMRLTLEQRLAALERDVVVLLDTTKLLHRLLKEQRQLISDYITQQVMSADTSDEEKHGNIRPENALYTFVCQQRFDKMEKNIGKIHKLVEDSTFGLKAG